MAKRVMKYNPAFLTRAELVDQFVVRHGELETVMETVRENTTEANRHVLVIGPRGSGKTMLARRVAAEINRVEELRDRVYPLIFSEESYEVTTPGEFWLEAIFHLGQQTKDPRWQAKYEDYGSQWQDEETMRERALGQLTAFADEKGKRLLLIVENFHALLGNQISEDDAWKLRHTLLNEPRVMLLATATSRFDEIDQANKAMYELFHVHHLRPLDRDDCRILWQTLTGQLLEGDRVRPIHILTGGNPRLLTILSTFGAQLSLRRLLDDLVGLVDEHTEYFKSHLDALPPTERKVYLALAERWDPSTARDVAATARLNVNRTSSLLGRLVDRGAVVTLDEPGRTKWYQVAERMYNVYYLFRRRGAPAQRVRAVVRFMISFYQPEQLLTAARRIADEVSGLEPSQRQDHYQVYSDLVNQVSVDSLRDKLVELARDSFAGLDDVPDLLARMIRPRMDLADVPAKVEEAARRNEVVRALKPQLMELEKTCRRAIEIDPQNVLAWVSLGFVYTGLSRPDDAEEAYRKAIEIEPPDGSDWEFKGMILHKNLSRFDDAEQAYRKAIEIDPENAWAWARLGLLLREELCRFDDAEEAYRRAAEIEPQDAWRWAELGSLLCDKLSRFDEAEEAFRRAIEIDPQNPIARGLMLSLLLRRPEHREQAIQFAESTIAYSPDNPGVLNDCAWALYAAGDRPLLERALAWAQEAVDLDPDDGMCQHTLASIQGALGSLQDALKTAEKYLADEKRVRHTVDDAVDLFVELAARGEGRGTLQVLLDSPSRKQLEPLVVGIRIFLGENVKVAAEIREIGLDVAKRIEERRDALRTA